MHCSPFNSILHYVLLLICYIHAHISLAILASFYLTLLLLSFLLSLFTTFYSSHCNAVILKLFIRLDSYANSPTNA